MVYKSRNRQQFSESTRNGGDRDSEDVEMAEDHSGEHADDQLPQERAQQLRTANHQFPEDLGISESIVNAALQIISALESEGEHIGRSSGELSSSAAGT